MLMESQLCLEFAGPFLAPAKRASKSPAEDVLRRVLVNTLPKDCTPFFIRVVRARFVGAGRDSRVIAEIELFDGLFAEVEAWKWSQDGWAYKWVRLEGGDMSWEDGRWWRITPEGERV